MRKWADKYLKRQRLKSFQINSQIQETLQTPERINPKKNIPMHIRVKVLKSEVKREDCKSSQNKVGKEEKEKQEKLS